MNMYFEFKRCYMVTWKALVYGLLLLIPFAVLYGSAKGMKDKTVYTTVSSATMHHSGIADITYAYP